MAFIKVIKTKAYYKRFQVKYRRRRCGKTDYRARLRLTTQDKNKYNTPKYRLIVRITNRDVICQVAYATLKGDVIVAAAYAHELPKYGIVAGLTNYAACYATGLLVARRTLAKYGLADKYAGCEEPDGEDYNVEENEDGPRPFFCVLDVGLKRTSTGAKVFGALKGACDGGLSIPHNEKRFAGYDKDSGLDAEMMKGYIYGQHVSEYMESMEEEDPEKYKLHFKKYIDAGVGADDIEEMYSEAHSKIREDPSYTKKPRTKPAKKQTWKKIKLTYDERKEALKQKLLALQAASA